MTTHTLGTPRRSTDPLRELRHRFFETMPEHFARTKLDADALRRLQTDRLRRLLAFAIDRSPFHRERLGAVDVATFTPDDLAALPPMTKPEMMASYDDVVTDPRLRSGSTERHLAALGDDPGLLHDEFVVLTSGGSSGVRGVFASDVAAAAEQMAAVVRGGLAGMAEMVGWPPPGPAPLAIVAAPSCVHATRSLASVFLPGPLADVTFAPVTAPWERIVEIVAAASPLVLIGYPSMIARLADERAAGRLTITPMTVVVTSEQLTDDARRRITDGFGLPPVDSYGTSEGLMGSAPPGTDVFEFASDVAWVEFVDADDQPVEVGTPADHVLVTNLCNHAQPLIRYRIDDIMTPFEPAPGRGHQRARLEGRADEQLSVGDVTVHPLTIRSALLRFPAVEEYQVRLESGGSVTVDVVGAGVHDVDLGAIERSVGSALERAGARAEVAVREADELQRDRRTGKLHRFVAA